jgi:hypothetical protein
VTSANTPVVVFALANDVDPNGDTISLTSHTVPSQGTTTFDAAGGTFLYTPRTGYVGADAFEYTITDGHGQFSTGLVTIQINAEPISPSPSISPAPSQPPSISPAPSQSPGEAQQCETDGEDEFMTLVCPYEDILMQHCYRCFSPPSDEVIRCDGWSKEDILSQCFNPTLQDA